MICAKKRQIIQIYTAQLLRCLSLEPQGGVAVDDHARGLVEIADVLVLLRDLE